NGELAASNRHVVGLGGKAAGGGGHGIDLDALKEDTHLVMKPNGGIAHGDGDVVSSVGHVDGKGGVGREIEVAIKVGGAGAPITAVDRATLPAVALSASKDRAR